MRYCYYLKDNSNHQSQNMTLPENYSLHIWKPRGSEYFPSGMKNFKKLFCVWWFMLKLGLFKNDDFGACIIYFNDLVAHYSIILPPFFKVPFLSDNDLQIGPVGTHEKHRRKGFAYFAINKILDEYSFIPRKFWYITKTDNLPSVKTCEKAGFIKYGEGEKKSNLPIELFSRYNIDTVFYDKTIR